MMTDDWTYPSDRPHDVHHAVPVRDRDHGYADAMALAYRQVLPDVPEDMMRLLARLN